ncbi:MAG: hypothetical protein ACRYG8_17190 [Janthinobacterium lividum]
MGLVDRLNRWALDRLPSRRGAVTAAYVTRASVKLEAGTRQHSTPWDEISNVCAVPDADHCAILVFGCRNGSSVMLPETMPGVSEVVAALSVHLPGAIRYARWSVELLAEGRHGRVEIYRR